MAADALRRWWDTLSAPERIDALRARQAGILPRGLGKTLGEVGVAPEALDRFLRYSWRMTSS